METDYRGRLSDDKIYYSVRFTIALLNKLKVLAKKDGRSLNGFIVNILTKIAEKR